VFGYIEPFYDAAPSPEPVKEAGHIWRDQPLYLPAKYGLRIENVDPHDDTKLDFRVVGRTADMFGHPPVKSLGLESTDAAIVARTKRDRPVVILDQARAQDLFAAPDRAPLADLVMAVPVYGADQFTPYMRRRVSTYEFRNWFYLPGDRALGFEEGFARLDQLQPVRMSDLRQHMGLALSEDALTAMQEWLIYFLTGHIAADSLILEYRRDELERLKGEEEVSNT
jgi:hypothetical protein